MCCAIRVRIVCIISPLARFVINPLSIERLTTPLKDSLSGITNDLCQNLSCIDSKIHRKADIRTLLCSHLGITFMLDVPTDVLAELDALALSSESLKLVLKLLFLVTSEGYNYIK